MGRGCLLKRAQAAYNEWNCIHTVSCFFRQYNTISLPMMCPTPGKDALINEELQDHSPSSVHADLLYMQVGSTIGSICIYPFISMATSVFRVAWVGGMVDSIALEWQQQTQKNVFTLLLTSLSECPHFHFKVQMPHICNLNSHNPTSSRNFPGFALFSFLPSHPLPTKLSMRVWGSPIPHLVPSDFMLLSHWSTSLTALGWPLSYSPKYLSPETALWSAKNLHSLHAVSSHPLIIKAYIDTFAHATRSPPTVSQIINTPKSIWRPSG